MESLNLFGLEGISEKDLFEQLGSASMKESEILDENADDVECGGILEEFQVHRPKKAFIEYDYQDVGVDGEDLKCEGHPEMTYDNPDRVSVQNEKSGNSLLRRTISELERALGDTKALLADRDIENNKVRSQFILTQERLEDEQVKCSQLEIVLKEKEAIIDDLNNQLIKERNCISDLQTELQNQPIENERRKGTCCAASKELSKIEKQNIKLEEQLKIVKAELNTYSNELTIKSDKICFTNPATDMDGRTKCRHLQKEKDLQTKLRMKFMRDAFFYFMIDYHAEEQLRAILAILEYEDKRQDLIFESHRMRQKGRKFTVSQVSSRKLTFVQQELK